MYSQFSVGDFVLWKGEIRGRIEEVFATTYRVYSLTYLDSYFIYGLNLKKIEPTNEEKLLFLLKDIGYSI